jgi:protein involved in polysaccharide export with SLBB domain
MKSLRLALLASVAATLFAAVCAGADMPTIGQDYGTNSESGAQFYNTKAPLGTPTAGNATTSTDSGIGTAKPNSSPGQPLVNPGNVTTPATGNTTVGTTPANGTAPAVTLVTPNTGPDFSAVPLPATMDKIDHDRKLQPHDHFVYQVVEDRDPPVLITVDQTGNITVPYLGRFPITTPTLNSNMTLQETAIAIQKELTKADPDGVQKLYKHATVLAAFYTVAVPGEVYVLGSVAHPGPVQVPTDSDLSLVDAIYAAGGTITGADSAHVDWTHRDPNKTSGTVLTQVNVDDLISHNNAKSIIVEAGDTIKVPSKIDTVGSVIVSGSVRSPGEQILPPTGSTLMVSVAILHAGGLDQFANGYVTIYRKEKDKDGKPIEGKPPIKLPDVDVNAVLLNGHTDQDVPLQSGDEVIANRPWYTYL